jgi:N-acetylglucosamine-6-phosphate deacetylase
MLGDFSVEVKDGVCLSHGALAGSVLTMDRAVENLRRFTGASLGTAVRLASRNSGSHVRAGASDCVDSRAPANFNRFNEAGERVGIIFHGRRAAQ